MSSPYREKTPEVVCRWSWNSNRFGQILLVLLTTCSLIASFFVNPLFFLVSCALIVQVARNVVAPPATAVCCVRKDGAMVSIELTHKTVEFDITELISVDRWKHRGIEGEFFETMQIRTTKAEWTLSSEQMGRCFDVLWELFRNPNQVGFAEREKTEP